MALSGGSCSVVKFIESIACPGLGHWLETRSFSSCVPSVAGLDDDFLIGFVRPGRVTRRFRPRPRDRFCRVCSVRRGFGGRGFSHRQSSRRGGPGSVWCRVRVAGVAIAASRRGRVAVCGPGFTGLGRVFDVLRRPISTRSIGWFWSLWTASSRAVRTPPPWARPLAIRAFSPASAKLSRRRRFNGLLSDPQWGRSPHQGSWG